MSDVMESCDVHDCYGCGDIRTRTGRVLCGYHSMERAAYAAKRAGWSGDKKYVEAVKEWDRMTQKKGAAR